MLPLVEKLQQTSLVGSQDSFEGSANFKSPFRDNAQPNACGPNALLTSYHLLVNHVSLIFANKGTVFNRITLGRNQT